MRWLLLILVVCKSVSLQAQANRFEQELQPAVFSLTMVMMHDVVNPPAAARFYTYCTLGAYDFMSNYHSKLPAPSGYFKNYRELDIQPECSREPDDRRVIRKFPARVALAHLALLDGSRGQLHAVGFF